MISLYIHIPFCKRKCDYCSFYSVSSDDKEEYIDAVIRCVKYYGKKTRQKVNTVYIGGGTPSVLPPRLLYRLLSAVAENFDIASDAEITAEANPESCSDGVLDAMRAGGVNRLSLGIQSLDDGILREIGRLHNAAQALDAIRRAVSHGFQNISCDMMFGLPHQTARQFTKELQTLCALDIRHISCYNLQVEDGTPLARKNPVLPGEENERRMYLAAANLLRTRGFEHYEISNYAISGFESRHNSVYWSGGDYLGLGPAAHSKLDNMRCGFLPDIDAFMRKTDFEFDFAERITDGDFEKLMLSLRVKRGVPLELLPHSAGLIGRLCKEGLADAAGGYLSLTDEGMYLSNSIISRLAANEDM